MEKRNPIKRVSKEKVAILHSCTQKEQIAQLIKNTDKLSIIITGNGTPSEGYVYKLNAMGSTVNQINEKLTGISAIVKELHEESIGKNAIVKKGNISWTKAVQIIGTVIALGMLLIGYLNITRQNKEVEDKVVREIRLQEGVSKVTRGGFVKYNDQGLSDSIQIKK